MNKNTSGKNSNKTIGKHSKKNKVEEQKAISGIFVLSGIKDQNQVKINHVDNMNLQSTERVSDTLVKKINIFKDAVAEIYKCNITDSFLMLSKKLPMMYISVIHEKPLRRILLFRVYIFFTITADIKSSTQMLNTNIDGNFSLEISIENTRKQLDDQIDKYPGDDQMYEKLTAFVLAPEMQELCKSLINEINIKLVEEYEKEFEYYKVPTNIISLKNYNLDE